MEPNILASNNLKGGLQMSRAYILHFVLMLASVLMLSGCDDKSKEEIDGFERQGIDPDHLGFRYEKPVDVEPEFEVLEDVFIPQLEEDIELTAPEFEDEEEDEIKKRELIESVRQLRASSEPMIMSARINSFHHDGNAGEYVSPKYRIKDTDYSRDKMPKNISSLPVDRSRAITAEKIIPVILEREINSQIPGRFVAIVESHVFGSDGRAPLLPKGARIICHYESLAKVGDTRLQASCERIIRPDGAHVLISNPDVGDQVGRQGLVGRIDNKNFERYGAAFAVSLISAATAGAFSLSDSTFAKTAAVSAALSAGQLSAKIIDENIDISPVTTVPAGSKMIISPYDDIWIRRPEIMNNEAEQEEAKDSLRENKRTTIAPYLKKKGMKP